MDTLERPRRTARPAAEDGIALVLSLWFTILVAGMVTAGTLLMQAHKVSTRNSFAQHSQAVQIARSGLTEALSWLRRQTAQPVLAFEPVLDTTAVPPILDTIDPDVGIVREFKITGSIWARYEVWKNWPGDPDPIRLAKRENLECEDISSARMVTGAGAVWRLRSMGYVYRRNDSTVPFDVQPNVVLARDLVEIEVQRLVLQLPGQGAVNVSDGNSCHINTNGRIIGGASGAGIYYPMGTGTPTTGPPAQARVTGTPPLSASATYDASYDAVFGMSLAQLRSMATMVITDLNEFPVPVPTGSLIVVENNSVQFDSTRPLQGNGIVVIVGNTVMSPGSYSNFSGFLYLDGNFTMRDPAEIRGAVICTGNMTLQGMPDYATIFYDDDVLNDLRQDFGNYRFSSAMTRPLQQDR